MIRDEIRNRVLYLLGPEPAIRETVEDIANLLADRLEKLSIKEVNPGSPLEYAEVVAYGIRDLIDELRGEK